MQANSNNDVDDDGHCAIYFLWRSSNFFGPERVVVCESSKQKITSVVVRIETSYAAISSFLLRKGNNGVSTTFSAHLDDLIRHIKEPIM